MKEIAGACSILAYRDTPTTNPVGDTSSLRNDEGANLCDSYIEEEDVTKQEFELALDGHRLWVREDWSSGPRWYLLRRNGRTKLWVRSPERWEIPVKYKLKECMKVNEKTLPGAQMWLRIGEAKVA